MVKASQIAKFLKLSLHGPDLDVERPVSIDNPMSWGVVFVKEWDSNVLKNLCFVRNILVLTDGSFDGTPPPFPFIVCDNPRLSFARVVQRFFCTQPQDGIAKTAIIDPTADIGSNVTIGHYSVIGPDVIIGDNVRVANHVTISNAVINAGCRIKSHSIIGEDGFGFEYDERGHPCRVPHTGKVVLADNVEIGAGTVICRGTVDATLVGPSTKIDDSVFIAHNVQIGMDTLIIAKTEISGSVTIGNHVWIGPSVSIKEHVNIGDGALIGIGANVLNDVGPGEVVVGNPAKFLRMREGV